jgi:hypothetical protein
VHTAHGPNMAHTAIGLNRFMPVMCRLALPLPTSNTPMRESGAYFWTMFMQSPHVDGELHCSLSLPDLSFSTDRVIRGGRGWIVAPCRIVQAVRCLSKSDFQGSMQRRSAQKQEPAAGCPRLLISSCRSPSELKVLHGSCSA